MALDVPASASGATTPKSGHDGAGGPRSVSDASPMAAEASFPSRGSSGERDVKVTRVVSPTISSRQRLREIWLSRELLIYLVRTEIKVKYKNSVLGLVWSLISPAMTLAIFYIVFTVIQKNGIPRFALFLFSGLLVWNLFQVSVLTGTGVVVNNAGIVKKVSFPREILALASVGSATVFFFFQSIVMIVFLAAFHSAPQWDYFPLIPLALVTVMILAAGLAILLSAVNVYLRDTQHLIEVVLTAWFWACPIVYSFQSTVASRLAHWHITWLYLANPLTPLVLSFERVLYGKVQVISTNAPHLPTAYLPLHGMAWYAALDAGVLAAAIVVFFVALIVFGRLEGNFAEEL